MPRESIAAGRDNLLRESCCYRRGGRTHFVALPIERLTIS